MEMFNQRWFVLINSLSGMPFWDALNVAIAQWSPYIFAAILIIYFIFRKQIPALHAVYSAALGLFVNLLVTLIYFHPRPFMLGIGQTLLQHANETSFPSDHATLAFSVAFSFILDKKYKIGILLFLLAIFTGFSRIYAGLHFPMDVIGSFMIGMLSALVVRLLEDRLGVLDNKIVRIYNNIFSR